MKEIKIAFTDFWPTFDPQDNFITQVMGGKIPYRVVGHSDNPDFLFYSAFGNEHYKFDCIKIYYTGENDVPDFNLCDYALSFHRINFGDRHVRIPIYGTCYLEEYNSIKNGVVHIPDHAADRKFCSIVVSNITGADPIRANFMHALSEYKHIDSGGRYANNVGGPVDDKMKFIAQYKFNLALENSLIDGYVTEKLIEPLAAGTIPIYWGGFNKQLEADINPECFINISDFNSFDSAIEYIKQVDSDPDLYLKMLHAPKLKSDKNFSWEDVLFEFIEHIFKNPQKYTPPFGMIGNFQYNGQLKSRLYENYLLRKGIRFAYKLENRFKNKK